MTAWNLNVCREEFEIQIRRIKREIRSNRNVVHNVCNLLSCRELQSEKSHLMLEDRSRISRLSSKTSKLYEHHKKFVFDFKN